MKTPPLTIRMFVLYLVPGIISAEYRKLGVIMTLTSGLSPTTSVRPVVRSSLFMGATMSPRLEPGRRSAGTTQEPEAGRLPTGHGTPGNGAILRALADGSIAPAGARQGGRHGPDFVLVSHFHPMDHAKDGSGAPCRDAPRSQYTSQQLGSTAWGCETRNEAFGSASRATPFGTKDGSGAPCRDAPRSQYTF